MKQNLQSLLVVVFLGSLSPLFAQDINFTQYELIPVFVNPANTGGFMGTYRISGIYRDRAPSFPGSFKSMDLAIDMNFGFAFRKKDWTSLAITFVQDRAGEINIGKGGFLAAGAYHLGLGKGNLAIGVQFGSVSQNVKNSDKGTDLHTITGTIGPSQLLMQLQTGKADYQDVSAGLVLTSTLSKSKHLLKLGFAAAHITQPTVSLGGSGSSQQLDILFTGSASLKYHLNEKTDIVPMLWFRNLSKLSELVPQCMISYLFNVEKKVRLNAGLGFRTEDALQLMAGVDYGNLKVQVGYDLTTSDLSNAPGAGPGALEIGVNYIGAITKKPNPKPKVFCPRF